MAQEINVKTAPLPLQEATSVDAANLVNSYADELVAGLFEDVDQLLDGDEAALAKLEQEISAPPDTALAGVEPMPSESSSEPNEVKSTALVPTDQSAADETMAAAEALLATQEQAGGKTQPPEKTRLGKLLDRFLLTTTVFSLLGILGFLVYSYQRGVGWFGSLATPEVETPPNQSDIEFLQYLDRSLEVIAKKAERGTEASSTNLAQMPNVSVLPSSPPLLPPLTPMPSAGALMAPGGGPVNVIERVYIPYQTAQQPAPGLALPQGFPGSQTAATPPQPQNIAPATAHMLVGLLELGERSAALFEIDGVPRRVYIGEPIGGSGWNLVSVSNDEARIRRNGEVRSIYIGQQF